MADNLETLRVALELANPGVIDQLKKDIKINIGANLSQSLLNVINMQDKQVALRIVGDDAAIAKFIQIREQLSKPINIKINIEDNTASVIQKLQRAALTAANVNSIGASNADIDNFFKLQDQVRAQALQRAAANARPGRQPTFGAIEQEAQRLLGGFATTQARDAAQAYQSSIAPQSSLADRAKFIAEQERLAQQRANAILSYNSATAPFSDINANKNRLASIDEASSTYQQAIAPQSSLADRAKFLADQKKQEELRAQAISNFQQKIAPFSSIEDEENRQAAISRYQQSVAPFSDVNENKNRVAAQREQFNAIARNTVLGALNGQGPAGLLGSLGGGIVGAKFGGEGGAALGSLIGGAVLEGTIQNFVKLTDALKDAGESGLEFERSILGISSTLQATTEVTTASGGKVGIQQQLSFQNQQARDIQGAARSRLSKIGISGEREATLVQAIVSGAAQRGIILNGDQAATLAERIGGAVQAQRPELLNNSTQLRRDVEDVLSGLPNRTALGSVLKGFAPGLGSASSAEDLLNKSKGLDPFVQSLQGTSDNPIIAVQRLNSAIDLLKVTLGDNLDKALIPGIEALAKALGNKSLQDGLGTLGTGLGTIGSLFGEAGGALTTLLTPGIIAFSDKVKLLGDTLTKVSAGDYSGLIALFTNLTKGQVTTQGPDKTGFLASGGDLTDDQRKSFSALRGGQNYGNTTASDPTTGRKVDPNSVLARLRPEALSSTLIQKSRPLQVLKGLFGDTDFDKLGKVDDTPEYQLGLLSLTQGLAGQVDEADRGKLSIGRNSLAIQALEKIRSNNSALVDTSDPTEVLSDLRNQRGNLSAQSGFAEANLIARNKERAQAQVDLDKAAGDSKTTPDILRNFQKKVIEASAGIKDAEDQLASIRLKGIEVAHKTLDAENALTNRRLQEIDQYTFSGQNSALAERQDGIDRQRADLRNSFNAGDISRSDFDHNNKVLDVGQAGLDRDKNNTGFSQAIESIDFVQNLKDFADSAKSSALKFKLLGDALSTAQEALQDFKDQQKLRKLGAKGERISAIKDYVSAGGDASLLPVGSLDDIDTATNPEALAQFQQDSALERLKAVITKTGRLPEDDQKKQDELENNLFNANKAVEDDPLKQLKENFARLLGLNTFYDKAGLVAPSAITDVRKGGAKSIVDAARSLAVSPDNPLFGGTVGGSIPGTAGQPALDSGDLFPTNVRPSAKGLQGYNDIVGGLLDSDISHIKNTRPSTDQFSTSNASNIFNNEITNAPTVNQNQQQNAQLQSIVNSAVNQMVQGIVQGFNNSINGM